MINKQIWYDAEDHSPNLVCLVRLKDGEELEATFVCGTWETLEGEEIQPISFMPLQTKVLTALYKPPFEIE